MEHYDGIIIGVNYCSTTETLQWARSILENKEKANLRLIVTDTSAEKKDLGLQRHLQEIDPDIHYLDPSRNLGYFGGARYAMEYIDQQRWTYEYIIVCNVDLRFISRDFSSIILKNLGPDIGVISPSIIAGGKDINPYKLQRMTRQQMKQRMIYLRLPLAQKGVDVIRRLVKKKKTESNFKEGQEIYMTYGACFILAKAYFNMGGDLNLPLFLYGEEPYIAETCHRLKLKTVYVPSIVVCDIGHVSTGAMPSASQRKMLIEATQYCLDNFYTE